MNIDIKLFLFYTQKIFAKVLKTHCMSHKPQLLNRKVMKSQSDYIKLAVFQRKAVSIHHSSYTNCDISTRWKYCL